MIIIQPPLKNCCKKQINHFYTNVQLPLKTCKKQMNYFLPLHFINLLTWTVSNSVELVQMWSWFSWEQKNFDLVSFIVPLLSHMKDKRGFIRVKIDSLFIHLLL